MRIAFQGVEGAYSQQAAREYFSNIKRLDTFEVVPKKDFPGVFASVQSGSVDYGIIPIENSLAGSIHQNYDLLRNSKVLITGEYKLRIKHQLIAAPHSKISHIKKVFSHPQALSQCSEFLKNMKKITIIPHFDTAGAVRDLAKSMATDTAAIAGKEAASFYNMKVLKASIENHESNYTRFFILVKKTRKATIPKNLSGTWKTSIVFALKSIPGCLNRCLSIFAIRDIDLLKIESRPLAGSPWKYLFYVDFAESIWSEKGKRTLGHLSEITDNLQILGCYPPCRTSFSFRS